MTDKEIKKALGLCFNINHNAGLNCCECPYRSSNQCSLDLYNNTIVLINRQQTEIESWKRLYENTCTELKELLVLEREIREKAIKEFTENLKERSFYVTLGRDYYKVISEESLYAIAERMGVNK